MKKEMWKGYTIVDYQTELGHKFYNVRKGDKYLDTFQSKKDAKRYIDKINEHIKN